MATNYKIVSPDEILLFKPTEWSLCFICQAANNDILVVPSKKLGYVPEKSLYVSTAKLHIMGWKLVEGIDRSLHCRLPRFNVWDELYVAFVENNACFHQNCLGKYNNQKLKRKQRNESSITLDIIHQS